MTDFQQLLRILNEAQVEFILVGGMAAIAHGAARLTQDLDVVYRRTNKNIARLVRALQDRSPYLRDAPPGLPFQWDERTVQRGLNFTLRTEDGDLDLFGEIIGGGGYEQLLPHTIMLRIYGIGCRCLDLEQLIRVKRAAGRPRDLDAVAELEVLREESPDRKR